MKGPFRILFKDALNRNLCSLTNGQTSVIPLRAYVGLTIFGLITGLLVLSYGLLWLTGYTPSPESPAELLFPDPPERDTGLGLFLAAAGAFCAAFTIWAWRRLMIGAREAVDAKKKIQSLKKELDEKRNPPGYN